MNKMKIEITREERISRLTNALFRIRTDRDKYKKLYEEEAKSNKELRDKNTDLRRKWYKSVVENGR